MDAPAPFDGSADALAPVVEALATGAPAEEEARLIARAAAAAGGEPEAVAPEAAAQRVRQAALRALAGEPETLWALGALEEWLGGAQDVEAAIPLATGWALPAAGLDLATASAEARLYIDAYPIEGRMLGDLGARAARWLAQRLALVQGEPRDRLPAVRRAIGTLAEAAADEFPRAAASLRAVAAELDDDRLWYELALRIAERQLADPS